VLNKNNIFSDINNQANIILDILAMEHIVHSDIKAPELLVKDNILYLVDFGWAILDGDITCGAKISDKLKPGPKATDDKIQIFKIIDSYLSK